MKVTTYEATVRDGQVLLPADAEIPNNTRVYVVVPTDEKERVRILSPRLVHRGDVTDFEMRVEREGDDARL